VFDVRLNFTVFVSAGAHSLRPFGSTWNATIVMTCLNDISREIDLTMFRLGPRKSETTGFHVERGN